MNIYNAAKTGDIATLQAEDPNVVCEVSFARSRNVLHIAAMHGHENIVEMLTSHMQLARDLDSQNSTPLHIAAAQGSVEVASILLSMANETLWWRDCHGLNPVHIAAIHGRVDILAMLLQKLISGYGEGASWRNSAALTIKYLVEVVKIKKQTRNLMGKTALQILTERPKACDLQTQMETLIMFRETRIMSEVFPDLSDTTMVVVGLIAAMAFQAAISPPGGVWQDTKKVGEAVMASTHPILYKQFVGANTTAFVSSIFTIFLITTRQPSGRILFLLISLFAMWVSLASIALSYRASVMVVAPHTETLSLVHTIIIVVVVSLGILGFIFVYNIVRGLCLNRTSDHHTTIGRLKNLIYELLNRVDLVVRRSDG
ncbi:ankyrin repeat-containing protein ITN1-like [Salvia hispanica]|uniref:ankyrin repeat-containing protein ITN1-like n=1 Tax=Salvia hispanica TaxID=49212 RepID=UPI0020091D4B|nr:ankyrin repeat-containing protein ITN1-like [Salvia hispanica]